MGTDLHNDTRHTSESHTNHDKSTMSARMASVSASEVDENNGEKFEKSLASPR